jgi:hypothetical protein
MPSAGKTTTKTLVCVSDAPDGRDRNKGGTGLWEIEVTDYIRPVIGDQVQFDVEPGHPLYEREFDVDEVSWLIDPNDGSVRLWFAVSNGREVGL